MKEETGFEAFIRRIQEEDQEILEALGSDFDEEGIPYWEKWGKEEDKPEFDIDEVW